MELPGINADFEVLLAIVFQNLQQPKNSQRKDAVASKNYREILNQESARSYLTESLTQSLTNKVNARTKEINNDAQKSLSKRGFNLFLLAPDFHLAAAIIATSKFTIANREELYNDLIDKNETVPAFKDKLRLLNLDFYYGHRLFKDGYLPGQEK